MNDIPSESGESNDWLKIARDCYTSSTSYLDTNFRKTFERNISLFQSKHPSGSKYNSPEYKHRSRLFRPKSRALVRKNEAAAAAAFFSNTDVVSIDPQDDTDDLQRASAAFMQQLLNYRLDKSIPWFLTVLGAFQDTNVVGVCASYQYWVYKEKPSGEFEIAEDESGEQAYSPIMEVVEDRPCVELLPIENIRFDPGANWTDVVNSSPYFIRMVPMYVSDVRQKMRTEDSKTRRTQWNKYDDSEIRAAMADYDSIRGQREDKKQDPYARQERGLKEFDIVWCHENFVRMDGEEMVYWTLGCMHMLTDPQPLKEVYWHGERPITIGFCNIETHKAIPESPVGMGSEMQKEVNDLANQRRDNVSLVLNKRYIVARNKQVDIQSLLRNVAGSVTMADNPDTDVREMNWPDVTGSAYAEQDRLNVDYDDLTGNFSQSSVMTNRTMNETVGGMSMLRSGASGLTEYTIRTFVETWLEKVLRQLVKLEQYYETDATILSVCGKRAELMMRYGIDHTVDGLLDQELTTRVNVGMNATDPQSKLQKFMGALQAYANVMQMTPDADGEAIRSELFGLAGYRDGARFFQGKDGPRIPPQVKQQLEQMQQQIQAMQDALNDAGMDVEKLELENEKLQADRTIQKAKAASEMAKASAGMDLTQAQTLKTLAEAGYLPSAALEQAGTNEG